MVQISFESDEDFRSIWLKRDADFLLQGFNRIITHTKEAHLKIPLFVMLNYFPFKRVCSVMVLLLFER